MEKAYIAGLLDGEGCVTLLRQHRGANRVPVVSISNNYRELLDPLKQQYGGSISAKRPANPNHKINYDWKLVGRKAISFLTDILPYMLHPEKIRRASLIIEEYLLYTPRNGKYTREMLRRKLQFEHDFFHPSTP